MEFGEGHALPPARICEIQGWINILDDPESTHANVTRAFQGLETCSMQESQTTRDSTAAGSLGAIGSLVRFLKRADSASRVGELFCLIFAITFGNPKVASIVESHAWELIPLIKEYGCAYQGQASFMDGFCLVMELLAKSPTAAPQLGSMIPMLMGMMLRPNATDRDLLVASCVVANFACTAATLRNRSLWRELDRHLDVAFLTTLVTSEASGERKGQTESILLTMYGDIEGHPAVRALMEYGAMESFVLPHLQHAYERTHWVSRCYWYDPSNFFLLRCISRPLSLARRLVEAGAAEIAAALVAQPEVEEDDMAGLVWEGKTSALIGLANLAGHAELWKSVAKTAQGLPLDALSRHEHAPLRTAAARLALELGQRVPEESDSEAAEEAKAVATGSGPPAADSHRGEQKAEKKMVTAGGRAGVSGRGRLTMLAECCAGVCRPRV